MRRVRLYLQASDSVEPALPDHRCRPCKGGCGYTK